MMTYFQAPLEDLVQHVLLACLHTYILYCLLACINTYFTAGFGACLHAHQRHSIRHHTCTHTHTEAARP
jgi:hypothetical protein